KWYSNSHFDLDVSLKGEGWGLGAQPLELSALPPLCGDPPMREHGHNIGFRSSPLA
ncbi:MAG: hypothetical protein RLZZ435_3753, partial [Cyanobacteriota bacterium]